MSLARPSLILAAIAGVAVSAGVALWRPLTIVDGDTIDYGWMRWRLAGFDAPEIGQAKCQAEFNRGLEARARLAEMLREVGDDWHIAPDFSGRRDPHERWIGRLTAAGENIGEVLIAEGLAVPYEGSGARADWCRVAQVVGPK